MLPRVLSVEVISYRVKNFEYKTPIPYVDQHGEICVDYVDESPVLIRDITFLYEVEMDTDGNVAHAKGIDVANAYLMHLVLNRDHKCVSLQSRSLIHYFSFLNDREMKWNEIPHRQNKRPTYRFKRYLEDLCRSKNQDSKLGVSTCQGYMRCVVNFYRYMLARRYPFDNAPFEHQVISISTQASASSMQATQSINIQTTDLRIKAAKTNNKNGVPSRLIALSAFEWTELDAVLRKDRRILRNINGKETVGALAIEFSLIFLLMRYSGLRREEAVTFKSSLITKPTTEQIANGYVTFRIGLFCGVETKNGKEREIEVPAYLMMKLREYVLSKRYTQRRSLYEDANPDSDAPVFINNKGQRFSAGTLNARWGEIRKMVSKRLGRDFHHKPHNLRASYAVFRLYTLLDAGIPQSDAFTFLQNKLGHSDLGTLLHYLQQVQEDASGAEKAEHVYDYLFNLSEFEF